MTTPGVLLLRGNRGFADGRLNGYQIYIESTPGQPEYIWDAGEFGDGEAESFDDAVVALSDVLAKNGVGLVVELKEKP
jgi:hypothetical protein